MEYAEIPDNFYLYLTEFLLHSKHQIINISAEFGLTSMQALTLLLTRSTDPRPMNALCKLYDCDASNITGIIDGLEQKKLVTRQPHPKDRRIKVIQLEAAGAKLRQKIAAKLAVQTSGIFSGLDPDEIGQLATLIQKVAKANY